MLFVRKKKCKRALRALPWHVNTFFKEQSKKQQEMVFNLTGNPFLLPFSPCEVLRPPPFYSVQHNREPFPIMHSHTTHMTQRHHHSTQWHKHWRPFKWRSLTLLVVWFRCPSDHLAPPCPSPAHWWFYQLCQSCGWLSSTDVCLL